MIGWPLRHSSVFQLNSNHLDIKPKSIDKYLEHRYLVFLVNFLHWHRTWVTWSTDKSSCWSRFWLSITGQLLPEPGLRMTQLPWLSLLLLLQVNISQQLFQENPEVTSLEAMKDFLTDDLIIKRFYVVVSLQVEIIAHSSSQNSTATSFAVCVPRCGLDGCPRDVEIFQSQRWHRVEWNQALGLCPLRPNWLGECSNKYGLCKYWADIKTVKMKTSLSFTGHRINTLFSLSYSTW